MISTSIRNPNKLSFLPTRHYEEVPQFQKWSKLQYAGWIERVKKDFHIGQFVTLSSIPPVPHRTPPIIFEITEIQEIHYMVSWSPTEKVPMPFRLRSNHGLYSYRGPHEVRALTNQEASLVKLQNIKPAGSA